MDTVDSQTRSKIMARVGQKNTGAELKLRRALHRTGLRYTLHDRSLPGSPDIVFPRFKAVVFVHGCYWHSHGCHRSTVPKSRQEFWTGKFQANRSRDARNVKSLAETGWRVLTVWECTLMGKSACRTEHVANAVRAWLESSAAGGEIPDSLLHVSDSDAQSSSPVGRETRGK
jgi:DNA mismatch endonuclease (patch repair protein)